MNNSQVSLSINSYSFVSTLQPWDPLVNKIQSFTLGTPDADNLQNLNLKSNQNFKGCLTSVEVGIEGQQEAITLTSDTPDGSVSVNLTNVERDCLNDAVCPNLVSDPCKNGATCEDGFNDYTCTNCPPEFYGKDCDVDSFCAKNDRLCPEKFQCADVGATFECKSFALFQQKTLPKLLGSVRFYTR